VRLTAPFVFFKIGYAGGLAGGSFIWPQADSASKIAISSSLSFSDVGRKHKRRYFSSDL